MKENRKIFRFTRKSLITLISCTAILVAISIAYAYNSLSRHIAVASYLDVSPLSLKIECKPQTLEITENNTLKFCLKKTDQAKRCEIAVHNLEPAPQINKVDFSFRLAGDIVNPDQFFGILQIHALPDDGEDWRCPNFAYDIKNGAMSIYNRWDKQALSKTVNGTCLGQGNSIKGRKLLPTPQEIINDQWYHIDLETILSHEKDGQITLDFADSEPQEFQGATRYNDKKMPYLKLGVYKPTPWTHGQEEICVEYKDVELSATSTN